MEKQMKQEKAALGIVGALIGGLIGGASIILFGQLGLISAISGVIMAFCTLKGYELLGGKLSKNGVIVCIVVMLVMPYVADRINWALVIVKEFQVGFGDAFRFVHQIVTEFALEGDYWKDLLFIYAFTALGSFSLIKQAFKQPVQNVVTEETAAEDTFAEETIN